MNNENKQLLWVSLILAFRFWLALILILYGGAKLLGKQFGVPESIQNIPLKEVDLFSLSWHLADHQPFKFFIGIAQVITAAFLVYRPTVIVGAFMSIPIWLNILVWDMTFMGLLSPFTFILSLYLLMTFVILYYYRKRIVAAFGHLLIKNDKRIPLKVPGVLMVVVIFSSLFGLTWFISYVLTRFIY